MSKPLVSPVKPRLIPILLLKHGLIVRSQLFKTHQVIGNPMSTVERYSHWNVDELIILDISLGDDLHDLRRDDLQQSYFGSSSLDVLREIAAVCFMPLTFGGRINSLLDIENRLKAGADKITLNTLALENPGIVTQAAKRFGSQCIVGSVDTRLKKTGSWEVYVAGGRKATGRTVQDWCIELERLGVGEILLNSIDRDGSGNGYDLDLISEVSASVNVPVIACGGVGDYTHFAPAIEQGAAAAAAANLFHFFELSYPRSKSMTIEMGVPLRPVNLGSSFLSREPVYDWYREEARMTERLRQAREQDYPAAKLGDLDTGQEIRWCVKCTYPSISAAPMEFDEFGVCTGCQMAEVKHKIKSEEWSRRKDLLLQLLDKYVSTEGKKYDVVIAVSGGKDSYYQVHLLKEEFGLNPLLVTYDGNNWTEVGWRNMLKMREVFDCDHILVRPSVETLKKLNRIAFLAMGDMNWHAHVGIMTVPMSIAVQYKIPLVFYGEHGYLDLCGQFTLDDFPEVSYRDRLEHFARGFEWTYFVDREGLSTNDLDIWKYPTDQEILDLDLRGIFLGNYIHWEANEHIKLVTELYGFEISEIPFDRTYRTMSNLDDMHENGVHDYLKYIKFGYGRATDHTCKDIRAGKLKREDAIDLVNHYDPIKPSDLARWLDYVDMTESEFDRIADTFRDKRVWWRDSGHWHRKRLK